MRKIIYTLLIFCFSIVSYAQSSENYLFRDSKTEYVINLTTGASETEEVAVSELQYYLKLAGNVDISVERNSPDCKRHKHIYVGWNKNCNEQRPAKDDDGFVYKTIGDDLYIYGGADRGTMYGVFSFVEHEFGVRWYTSDYTKSVFLGTYSLPKLNHREKPYFTHRLDFYYKALNDEAWCAHNMMNEMYGMKQSRFGRFSAYYGIHTSFSHVSPDQYYGSHPEYFSMRRGKRINDGQLCLSNKEVASIMVASVLKTIKENPGYWIYDVSQMDNQNYCECNACSAIANRYGGQSGLMVWFVNKVAREVNKVYPDVKIGTFAYQYTRHAPKNIRPGKNVVIRLCDIECCQAHTIGECESGQLFLKDLHDWQKLTKNIYVWSYAVDFSQYLAPFPNIKAMAGNIRLYSKSNVVGLMEEAQYETEWGEFSELRQWLIAKLLWNPYQDVDSLAEMFIKDYYGIAAKNVLRYYKMSQGLVNEGTHFYIVMRYDDPLFTEKFIRYGMNELEMALAHVEGDAEMTRRVNRVIAQLYALKVCRNYAKSRVDGTYDKLKRILDADKTFFRENGYDLDRFLKEFGFI